jgi:hypothetical protein
LKACYEDHVFGVRLKFRRFKIPRSRVLSQNPKKREGNRVGERDRKREKWAGNCCPATSILYLHKWHGALATNFCEKDWLQISGNWSIWP